MVFCLKKYKTAQRIVAAPKAATGLNELTVVSE